MSARGLWADYAPPGPKAHGWLLSDAEIAGIIGPYGSAKTTTGSMKCIRVTAQQHPSTKDGVRRAIITAVRPNYRRMHDTIIPSVRSFFGKAGQWDGPKNGPQDFFLEWNEPIGGRAERCEMLIQFRAFGDEAIESFVRGFQPTAWWGNEFDELPRGAISKMVSRAGRAFLDERPDLPPVTYCKFFGDCNMPDLDNWVHDILLKNPEEGVEIFLQPSGFSPKAENIENLRKIDPNYYENMAARFRAEGDEASVKRFIENLAGYTPHGKPVYPQFVADRHIVHGLTPDPMRQLLLACDQGGQFACAVMQKTRGGVVQVLREIVPEPGAFYGGEEAGAWIARVLMDEFPRYVRRGGFRVVMDPAAKQRHSGTKDDDPRCWAHDFIDALEANLDAGFEVDWDYAATNVVKRRVAAVKKLLVYRNDRGEEGFAIDAGARVAARGFAGGYRYMNKQGKPGEYHPEPDKNHYSNIHDAMQYGALEFVAELAGEDRDDRDPFARVRAAALAPQAATWGHDEPTNILM